MKSISILKLTIWASKKRMKKSYGKQFRQDFVNHSLLLFKEINPTVPDIGKSFFRLYYNIGVCYVVWYKVLTKLNFAREEIIKEIWALTNDFMCILPKPIMQIGAQFYFKHWRKEIPKLVEKSKKVKPHEYDWKITFNAIDKKTFEVIYNECGMKKLFQKYDVMELMPGVCRIDYMMFNYMNIGFERTKTLGDGDECCNCKYNLKGRCEWSPEKGFVDRK